MKKGFVANRNKIWKTTCTILAVILFFVGLPFLFTENPMWGVLSLIGVFFGAVAMLLAMKSKAAQKAGDCSRTTFSESDWYRKEKESREFRDYLVFDNSYLGGIADNYKYTMDRFVSGIDKSNLPNEIKKDLKEKAVAFGLQISIAEERSKITEHKVDIERECARLAEYYNSLMNSARQVLPFRETDTSLLASVIYDEVWKQAEKERIKLELESKDKRYKCCKNGHCYMNIEHKCRWCGEDNVVDRLDMSIPICKKVLYVGQRDGRWLLTTDSNIDGKSERIRSITIDMVGKYKLYYHMDGQNPNPFCDNIIKIGMSQIKGSRLVQLCDKLIDEELQEVDLF